jgi:hypothetical protein
VTVDRRPLFDGLGGSQPSGDVEAPIWVPSLVRRWLADGPGGCRDRDALDALCRQIDVRKRVSEAYEPEWKRREPETMVGAEVMSGLVAVLLGDADARLACDNDVGFALKCVNSALKAVDLVPGGPQVPALRAWAVELLDGHTGGWER